MLNDERLIPARAGNMIGLPHRWQGSPAHPRSRGEHLPRNKARVNTYGSSPLARGTFRTENPRGNDGRLIPARAGNIQA